MEEIERIGWRERRRRKRWRGEVGRRVEKKKEGRKGKTEGNKKSEMRGGK